MQVYSLGTTEVLELLPSSNPKYLMHLGVIFSLHWQNQVGRCRYRFSLISNSKAIPTPMPTRFRYVVNNEQTLVNVVKERPLGCSYSSSSSASLSCSTVLLSVPRAKRENFFLHNVAMGIKYLKNMLNGVYYYRRKRRTRAISERAPRGRSQTTFTRRGRQVFHKCPLFVNVYTIENVNARGQVVKKKPKSCKMT